MKLNKVLALALSAGMVLSNTAPAFAATTKPVTLNANDNVSTDNLTKEELIALVDKLNATDEEKSRIKASIQNAPDEYAKIIFDGAVDSYGYAEEPKIEKRYIPFKVIRIYNPQLADGEINVIQEGKEGLEEKNDSGEWVVVQSPEVRIIEVYYEVETPISIKDILIMRIHEANAPVEEKVRLIQAIKNAPTDEDAKIIFDQAIEKYSEKPEPWEISQWYDENLDPYKRDDEGNIIKDIFGYNALVFGEKYNKDPLTAADLFDNGKFVDLGEIAFENNEEFNPNTDPLTTENIEWIKEEDAPALETEVWVEENLISSIERKQEEDLANQIYTPIEDRLAPLFKDPLTAADLFQTGEFKGESFDQPDRQIELEEWLSELYPAEKDLTAEDLINSGEFKEEKAPAEEKSEWAEDIAPKEEEELTAEDLFDKEIAEWNEEEEPNKEELTAEDLFGKEIAEWNEEEEPNKEELTAEDLFGNESAEWAEDIAPKEEDELTAEDVEWLKDNEGSDYVKDGEDLDPTDLFGNESEEWAEDIAPKEEDELTAEDVEWKKDNEGSDYVKDGEDLDPTDLFGNESAEWAEDIAPELPEEATADDFTWREDHKRAEDSEDDLKSEDLWAFDEFENEEWSDDQGEFNPFEDEKEYIEFENEEWVEDVEDNELTLYSEFENAEWTNTDKELEEVEWLEVEEEREIDPNDPTTFPIFTDHEYKEKEIDPNDPTTFPLFEDHELAEEEEEESTTIENSSWTDTENEVISIAEILGGNGN